MKRPHTKGEGVATQECGARRSRRLALVIGVVVGLGLHLSGCLGALGAEDTLEWREEVALHDGEILIVTRWMQFVPGEPFKTMPGSRRLTFTHPTTGQAIVWENAGKIGSRVNPKMLDFDVGRPFLVTMAQSGPDYDGFGCPTPPYVVFRHDAGTWVRVPVAELPSRLVRMNLVTFPNRERLKAEGYFIRAAVTARSYKEIPGADNYALNATVDRRIRNPRSFGCSRGAMERIYGPEKYQEWKGTGTWLEKSTDEVLKLLRRKSEGAKP